MLTNIIKDLYLLSRCSVTIGLISILAACSNAPKKADVIEVSSKESIEAGKPVLIDEDKAKFNKGIALISEESYPEAEVIFTELIAKHPKLAGAYVNLGLIQQAQKKNEEAIGLYEDALSINPKNVSALVQLALINQSDGKFKEAERLLNKAHKLQGDNAIVNYNLGVLYELYLQDYGQAIKHYRLYLQSSADEDTKTVERWIKMLERK